MSKTKQLFIDWLKTYPTLAQIDAATWDEKITEAGVQKAIRKSTKAQVCYSMIEANLASQYAKLISMQLDNAFSRLDSSDFRVPKGFSDKTKASTQLKAYFELRDLQEQFMRADILKNNIDARVHAFRRWITVAEILIHKHHYEAAFSVLLNLSTLDDQYRLSRDLPSYSKKVFDSLLTLLSPFGNFGKLRQCIAQAKAKKTIPVIIPFAILTKDITSINEYLDEDEHKSLSEIAKTHRAYDNFVTKEMMLDEFMSVQPTTVNELPEHLQALFDKLTHVMPSNEAESTLEELPLALPSNPRSNLYSQKLSPTLWSRRGSLDKSDRAFWEDMLKTKELPTPLR